MSAKTRLCGWAALMMAMAAVGWAVATEIPPPVESGRLLNVNVAGDGEGLALRIESDIELTYDTMLLSNPDRVVLDLVGVSAPLAAVLPPDAAGVRDLRFSLWKDSPTEPIVRYVLETAAKPSYGVVQTGTVLVLNVGTETPVPPSLETAPGFPAEQVWQGPVPAEAGAEAGEAMAWLEKTEPPAALPAIAPLEGPEARADAEPLPVVTPAPLVPRPAIDATPGFLAAKPTDLSDLIAMSEDPENELWVPAEDACPEAWDQAVILPLPTDEEPVPEVTEAAASAEAADAEPEPAGTAAVADAEPEPVWTAEVEDAEPSPAWTADVGEAEEIPATESEWTVEVAEAPPEAEDIWAESIARYLPDAQARAAEEWTKEMAIHDHAPLLGDLDADFQTTRPAPDLPPMSLDVQGSDIQTILRAIAEYSGMNIVADANVKGTLTLRALDLPWPDMLQTVCRAMGMVALDHGSVIRVATERTAQEEALARESAARQQEDYMPLETRIVELHYANAEELQDVVNTMRSGRGKAEVDTRTNALVLTDIVPRLDLIAQTLLNLDSQTMQVEITAEIVDVDATVSDQLGINWGVANMHSTSAAASGAVGVTADDILTPVGQVQVGVLRSFGEIYATLQMLASKNQADIISTPRITTVNNRMARILVGKEVPLITMDEAGNAITELKKVGITLEVTPYVNSENEITLDLHPEVSDLSSQATVQGGVVFNTTEADTRVMVEQGQTAVIGGLIRTATTDYDRGVPYLKDVPIVGNLFKSSDKHEEKRELLIFVTPRIVPRAEVD